MIKISFIVLALSILNGSIEFSNSENFPDYDVLERELDKTLKNFLDEGGHFKTLNKRVVKFSDITFKRNIIHVEGNKYYCGDYIHSNSASDEKYIKDAFHKNALVEIYSMFNVVYSIQKPKNTEFVLSISDLYKVENIHGEEIIALIDGQEAPKVKDNSSLTTLQKFKKNKHITYPAIPAFLSITFFCLAKTTHEKYENSDDPHEVGELHLETIKYRNYALYSGLASISIAIPLNFTKIERWSSQW